jgi:2-polyprenylphenol 6-hydroxylase
MQKKYDIIIIGAGVAGLSLAALIADLNISVLVVDKQSSPENSKDIDLMQRALNHTSQQILEEIGVWGELSAGAYESMFVWDDQASIQFKAKEVGRQTLGHIVSYRELRYALYDKLKAKKNVTFLFDANPKRFTLLGKRGVLQLEDRQFTADLVVGADGKYSWLRSSLGVACSSHSYGESALVANVKTSLPHQQTAWQRFLSTGPLAFLPLSDAHTASIVWTNETSESQRLLQLSEKDFLAELNRAFENKLGDVVTVSKRAAFPLSTQHAEHYVGQGWALIADAAHAVHPLAGLGLNLGLGDVRCLAELIKAAVPTQQAIGELSLLRGYERTQRSKNKKLLFGMHQLHEIFLTRHQAVAYLRDFGVNKLDELGFAKRFFIGQVA